MITHLCDRCGRPLETGEQRYVAKIKVFAAADRLEISAGDLLKDQGAELARLLRECEALTEEELMQDVFVEFQFDLCRPCQRAFLRDPLARGGGGRRGDDGG